MRNFAIRLIINAVALTAAAYFVSGIALTGGIVATIMVALIFGFVNAMLKPIISFFSFPVIFVTLGLFKLVINGAMLLITAAVSDHLAVAGIGPAIVGSLWIAVISMVMNTFLDDDKDKD